jgi:hypothetical protein
MKRRFAVLTVLGALLALAVPASSMAAMYPAGHKFEIVGASTGPKFTTSLGSCPISKITVEIPAAPENETGRGPASLTMGACTSGTSVTVSSGWKFGNPGDTFLPTLTPPSGSTEALVMRFSSLPGCKLAGAPLVMGVWSNGVTTPKLMKSGFHAHAGGFLKWANDGGTCALAGEQESVVFEDQTIGVKFPGVSTVNNLTSPTTPIIAGPKK